MPARLGTAAIVLASTLLAGCTVEGCRSDEHASSDAGRRDAGSLTDAEGVPTGACSPTQQTSECSPDLARCTWVHDQENPDIGHIACVPEGSIPLGGACGAPSEWTLHYDDCTKGTVCVEGECRQICDPQGGTPACNSSHTCSVHSGLFENAGSAVAGVCDIGCNPLTQELAIGTQVTACGSTIPDAPDRGCYGYDDFSCTPNEAGTTRTDRTMPMTNGFGNAFSNGCSPGFIPLFYEGTGFTRALCTGLCAALETDNTPAHAANGKGDPTALAKLPDKPAVAVGDGTCEAGKKGSEDSSMCHFLWPYLVDDAGQLPVAFGAGPLRDTLGVCMAIAHFKYDTNGDGTEETPFPDCATLPPYSSATPGKYDDASDFACQMFTHTPSMTLMRQRAFTNARIATGAPVLARHELEEL